MHHKTINLGSAWKLTCASIVSIVGSPTPTIVLIAMVVIVAGLLKAQLFSASDTSDTTLTVTPHLIGVLVLF
jgi:hypothetical protein